MSTDNPPELRAPETSPGLCATADPPRVKTLGEKYEGIAFTFCKAATIILLMQKFALPVASGAASLFYVLAYFNGKKDTCCVLRAPLFISLFWGVVCVVSSYLTIRSLH
jgi:hypothetical protein